ncbi:MAG: hypothetical protein P4L31_08235 [Candidatus Babeliales bacterium]|nr:hypothetical protein [Candidatus Babeliales bacterium]
MNKMLYIVHQYVTKILLVPLLAYAFLTHGCPTCQYRLEANSPAFFTQEYDQPQHQTSKITNTEIEVESQEEPNA